MSYSGYKSSPRGGRGFSRGGYRGSSRGGGDGGSWRGGGRGYTSSSRGSGRGGRYTSGAGKWDRDASSGSYDSRSRYNSGGERYSSHGREEGSYRTYRGDESMSSYSSRDHSHRASSPDRKRMRPDYSPASSMHRSHDYGEGIEYSSRSYGGYEGKRMSNYGDERRNMFREERERIRSDDYQFRKPMSVGGPRHSTPRGSSYRGRSFSRGLRGGFRRTEPYRGGGGFIRKRTLMEGYGIRRRIATGRTQDYLRRIKMLRIQRLRKMREHAEKGEGSDDDDEDDDEEELVEEEEEIEEEITDEDNEEMEAKSKEEEEEEKKKDVDNEDEEMEEGGDDSKDDQKKKTKKIKKIVKIVKKVKRKVPKTKESEDENKENSESKEIHVTVKQDSEGRDVDAPVRKNYLGQPFIKLECPHCHTSAVTFKDYMLHLYKSKHQAAMTNLTVKVRKTLAKMRLEQRTEQREIDEECKLKNMNMRTFYCTVCKLNYRSLKSEHLHSDKHKEMLKFLHPYCKICRASCGTPMLYENHICSLNHLKRKHYFDKKNAERQEGGNEVDLDKYMILDQVGSGEEEEDSDSESSEKEEKEKETKEGDENAGEEGAKEPQEKKPKKKKAINLGSEFCKKMEIYFCDLCKTFLPRIEDQEQALAVHCRGRSHLRWYVKKKDDLALRKRAERIHRMREEQRKALEKGEVKEEPMDEDAPEDQPKGEPNSKKQNSSTDKTENAEVVMDEKLWVEVNKDLGELLGAVEEHGMKSSDDEEDSRAVSRRYDRFKHSEKGKTGAKDETEKGKSMEEKSVKVEVVNGDDDKDDA